MFNRSNSYSNQNGPNRRRFVLILIGGLILLMAFIGAVSSLKQSAEKKAADTFVNAVYAGDSTKSYNVSSSTFKRTVTPEKWNSKVTAIHSFYKDKPKYVRSHTDTLEDGTLQTRVYYTIEGISSDYDAQVWLSKSKEGWLVDYFGVAPRN